MKTIDEMVREHRPFSPMEKFPVYLFKWAGLSLLVLGIFFAVLPTKPDLAEFLPMTMFEVENFLWIALSLCCGIALYDYSFPDNKRQTFAVWATAIFFLLLSLSLFHSHSGDLLHEATQEMGLWRGRCGFIILAFAVIHTGFLSLWARRGASASPRLAALWAAGSASALGCFLMQFICLYENSLHLLIWHFLPLGGICFLAQLLIGKKLRW